MGFFDNLKTNTLTHTLVYGGSQTTLSYFVTDSSGNPVNISAYSCSWAMSPFGTPNYPVLSKSGTLAGTPNNQFNVVLTSADTATLGGMYICQPMISLGGVDTIIGQGTINIVPKIA